MVSIATCVCEAGGVAKHLQAWHKITSDPALLDVVKNGARIEFLALPSQKFRPETKVRNELAVHLDNEFQKFLQKQIIEVTQQGEGNFYSTVFLWEKKDKMPTE